MRSLGIAGPPGLQEGIYYLYDRYNGRILYEHFCSNDSFAPGDLLIWCPSRKAELGEFYLVEQAITYSEHKSMFPEMWPVNPAASAAIPSIVKEAVKVTPVIVDPLEAMREKILKERVSEADE